MLCSDGWTNPEEAVSHWYRNNPSSKIFKKKGTVTGLMKNMMTELCGLQCEQCCYIPIPAVLSFGVGVYFNATSEMATDFHLGLWRAVCEQILGSHLHLALSLESLCGSMLELHKEVQAQNRNMKSNKYVLQHRNLRAIKGIHSLLFLRSKMYL